MTYGAGPRRDVKGKVERRIGVEPIYVVLQTTA